LLVMLQSSVFERFAFDPLALGEDHLGPPEVDIGWGEIVEALMVAGMVIVKCQRASFISTPNPTGTKTLDGVRSWNRFRV